MILAGGDTSLITVAEDREGDSFNNEPGRVIAEKLKVVPIEDISYIEANKYPVIKDYLQQRRPEKHLDEIEQVLKLLRDAIEKHFSLKDILLSVGDRRNVLYEPYTRLRAWDRPPPSASR